MGELAVVESTLAMAADDVKAFDAFLSHAHEDAEWVEALATRLTDEHGFRIWLDKWVLVPGKSWQQAMGRGLEEAVTCAVCVGARTPKGWFQQDVERALDLQSRDDNFRVIPVLLPDATDESLPAFLALRTWADFRTGRDAAYAFHVLKQGIRGEPIGRWRPHGAHAAADVFGQYEQKIIELQRFRGMGLHDEVIVEFERKILDRWLDDGGKK